MAFATKLHEIRTLDDFEDVVTKGCIIFGKKYLSSAESEVIVHSMQSREELAYKDLSENIQEMSIPDEEVIAMINWKENSSQREKSSFYRFFVGKRKQVLTDNPEEEELDEERKNLYYSKTVLNIFQDFYVAYLPLFSRIVACSVYPTFNRMSNAVVESHFRVLKHEIHEERNMHAGDFIRAHAIYTEGMVKEVALLAAVPFEKRKYANPRGTKKATDFGNSPHTASEVWSKRNRLGRVSKYLFPRETSGEKNVVLAKVDKIHLKKSDLRRLLPGQELNDNIIEAAMLRMKTVFNLPVFLLPCRFLVDCSENEVDYARYNDMRGRQPDGLSKYKLSRRS